LISTAFPYRGGIAATTDRLALEYQKQNIPVEIWSFKMLYPGFLFPGKTQFHDEKINHAPAGIKIERKISSLNPFNWLKVGRQLRREKNCTVVIRFWIPFLAPCLGTIARIGKTPDKKIICLADNVIPHERRLGDKLLSHYFFKRIDGFVVMAEQGLTDLKQHFQLSTPAVYSPHPVFDIYGDPVSKKEACEKLKLDAETKYILFFGLIRKYKGLDLLLESFSVFSKNHPDYKLIIAGEAYENWAIYQKIIDDHQLADKIVRMDSFIANHEVRYYFGASEFLALTYHHATQSGVTQIAYSLDLPMLVTNVGDLANMVKHDYAGQVCESNTASVIKAMDAMASDQTIERYKAGVKAEKVRFEWSYLCERIDKVVTL
jgi:glycosyltransferase involved in cell wall biosynthesis